MTPFATSWSTPKPPTIWRSYSEEAPDDARLRAVTDYVRAWPFPNRGKNRR